MKYNLLCLILFNCLQVFSQRIVVDSNFANNGSIQLADQRGYKGQTILTDRDKNIYVFMYNKIYFLDSTGQSRIDLSVSNPLIIDSVDYLTNVVLVGDDFFYMIYVKYVRGTPGDNFIIKKLWLNGSADRNFGNQGTLEFINYAGTSASGLLAGNKLLFIAQDQSSVDTVENFTVFQIQADGSYTNTSLQLPDTCIGFLATVFFKNLSMDSNGNYYVGLEYTCIHNINNVISYIIKFHADGRLDATFGNKGWYQISISPPASLTNRLKAVVTGPGNVLYIFESDNQPRIIVRKLIPGSGFDNTFGINGELVFINKTMDFILPIYDRSKSQLLFMLSTKQKDSTKLYGYSDNGMPVPDLEKNGGLVFTEGQTHWKQHEDFSFYTLSRPSFENLGIVTLTKLKREVTTSTKRPKKDNDPQISLHFDPMEGSLHIQSASLKMKRVNLYNCSGYCLTRLSPDNTLYFELSMNSLTGGIYFVHITDENGNVHVEKFLKLH
ncbi:MAG: hypothetical protein M3Q56_08250 [Bacteroidota bacterium]|nr:hypothetical protein [Bacteroidota bacterium]